MSSAAQKGVDSMTAILHVDQRWFQNQLQDKHISQRKLAKMLDLDPSAVSLMFKGRRKMTAAEAAELARLLNVSVDEILTRAGAGAPSRRSVKVTEAAMRAKGFKDVQPTPQQDQPRLPQFDEEFMRKWMDLGLMLLRRG